MNLRMGNQVYRNVEIPLLWGQRAILQDKRGQISIIDLSGETARIEILCDEPGPNVQYIPQSDGIIILRGNLKLYQYDPAEKFIRSLSLGLPDVEIGPRATIVGNHTFSGNTFSGPGVGLAVRSDGISIGGPVPPGLAKLAF